MSSSTEPRISVGYVRRAHGIRGDVVVRPLTDSPERFAPGSRLTTDEVPARTLEVAAARPHQDGLLVRFDGCADRDAAEALRGVTLTIAASERRTLDQDEFWPDDLQGLLAIAPDGRRLGKITAVELGDVQDRLVITTSTGTTVRIPFVDDLVGEVHPSGGHVVVRSPEMFFPGNSSGPDG